MRGKPRNIPSLIAIAALLASFAIISWTAVKTKTATADEPLHAMSAYLNYFHHDYRLNCEHPPLWKYWAMLPQSPEALHVDLDAPQFKALPDDIWGGVMFAAQTMYRTPGNDPD